MPTSKSYCRVCPACCGIEVDTVDGRAVAVRGDRDNPMSRGYTCVKGRSLADMHNSRHRLRASLRRDGARFEPIEVDDAIDRIAAKLADIIGSHGPDAVALFRGTGTAGNVCARAMSEAWMQALGSTSFFSPVTIDQPAKLVAMWRHGLFLSGTQEFQTADTWMLIGTNPLVSHTPGPNAGVPGTNPSFNINQARRNGLKLIVVDPRYTETARRADLHLPIRPGEDAALLAGILRILLERDKIDQAFCDRYTVGVERLRAALAPFTLDYVAERTGLPADKIETAARWLGEARRGGVNTGTGPDMARYPNLTEHLALSLIGLRGFYKRAGERVANPGALAPPRPVVEQAVPPSVPWRQGRQPRNGGLGNFLGELPTMALADEILTPGPGQIRALFLLGGNPAAAIPDQMRTVAALKELDLLVTLDPWMSATARLADYIIAPTLALERPEHTTSLLDSFFFPEPYAQYSPAVVVPPAGVIDDWRFFFELARRMGLSLDYPIDQNFLNIGGWQTVRLDMSRDYSSNELLELSVQGARVPLSEVKRYPSGKIFADHDERVMPGDPDAGKLDFAPDDILVELRSLATDGHMAAIQEEFPYRLITSRLKPVINSTGVSVRDSDRFPRFNPAFIHPEDLQRLRIADGVAVTIESARGAIQAVAAASRDISPGVIAMAPCWGGLPDEGVSPHLAGSSSGLLVDAAGEHCPITGIPIMTGIPVRIHAAAEAAKS